MFKYINFLLLAILLLIFSCDEELKPVIEGCTIETACNYNANATDDDDSCVIGEGCNQWCNGDEGEPLNFDCAFNCGGDLLGMGISECINNSTINDSLSCITNGSTWDKIGNDECGVCDGDGIADGACDCSGNVLDECGECGGTGIPFGQCDCDGNVEDCAGECSGSAVEDECGVCDADASNDNTPLTGTCDCNGFPNGNAVLDNCGTCDSDSSNDCPVDCNGDWDGSAYTDDCDDCVGGNTEFEPNYAKDDCGVCDGNNLPSTGICDCAGVPNGDSWDSDCGCVVVDNSGDDCDDCAGTPDGDAVIDECGVCDATYETQPVFPYGTCDCNGDPNGEASIDGCEDCVGGDTGLTACANDCSGNPGGLDIIDNCGACVPAGDTSCVLGCDSIWCNTLNCPQLVDDVCDECGGDGPEEYHDCDGNCLADLDCAEVCGGSLVIDDCSVCGGNNDCIGCNDWYMGNFICDDSDVTDKCCVEDPNNSDYNCKMLLNTGANCDVSTTCQLEYEMECDLDGEYCDYGGAIVGDPCSTSEGSFTEGEGFCRKLCNVWLSNCFNIACNNPLLDEYCDYDGAEVGTPCSTAEGSFIEGEGLCVLDLSDDLNFPTGYITNYDTECADGTDDCCEEPECDEPFTLSLEYIDASTLQVNYSSTEAIGGFQFDIDGASVTGASGGDFEQSTNYISVGGIAVDVLGYVFGGSFPAGSGTLTNLNVDTGVSTQLCLQNVIVSDNSGEGNAINTCPIYWQLTCIPIPQFYVIILTFRYVAIFNRYL